MQIRMTGKPGSSTKVLVILLSIFVLTPVIQGKAEENIVEKAESTLTISRWIKGGGTSTSSLTLEPPEKLRAIPLGGESAFLVNLGKLAFRSPLTLGGNARRLALSCNTCHPNGGANTEFFFEPVSDQPGNIDVTHFLWNELNDDGLSNPINIPTLRGIRLTAPYGRRGVFSDLSEFTRNVVVTEFARKVVDPLIIEALVAYQRELEFLADPGNETLGMKMTRSMPNEVRLGAKLFKRDCARCHVPSFNFLDGQPHDVGTGGYKDTPTLIGLAESGPYLSDGSAANLIAVIRHFENVLGLNYAVIERLNLVKFLTEIGAVDLLPIRTSITRDMERIHGFSKLLEKTFRDKEFKLAEKISDMLRLELARVFERFHLETHEVQRATLIDLSVQLGKIIDVARTEQFDIALNNLWVWRNQIETATLDLEAESTTSLYDVDVLQGFVSEAK